MTDFKAPERHIKFKDKVKMQQLSRVFYLACHDFFKALKVQVAQDLFLLTQVSYLFAGFFWFGLTAARLSSLHTCRLSSV